jgi:hypothetical protein
MPTSGRVRKYRQRMEEIFKSTCVGGGGGGAGSSSSSNIESGEEFFGFE